MVQNILIENEEWRDIQGYEGYYQVSNLGRVKSLPRKVIMDKNGNLAMKKGKVLKLLSGGSTPYYIVGLHKEGVRINYFVHRLVAQAFIPNPDNLPMINHKSEVKTDNRANNLEWCTGSYNNLYGNASKKRKQNIIKPIFQINRETDEIIAEYESAEDAGRKNGCCSANIRRALNNYDKGFTAYNYIWKYKEKPKLN